ncbi:MAG: sialidase family protein, partial [Kofleriaceae bacterium]
MRALVAAIVVAASATASAGGGRLPATNRIEFRAGHPGDILVGTTFGFLVSHDSGATWRYMCPVAAHYDGTFDPDYAYSANGLIAVTSFDGVAVMRDGCTFAPTPLLAEFASQLELDHQGGLDVALADPAASAIAHSPDDGLTFPQVTTIGVGGDWWQSLLVSGDGVRIYVSGYRAHELDDSILLLESHDGGASFAAMAAVGLTTTSTSTVDLVAIDPNLPQRIYARVNEAVMGHYDFYRSDDAGASWTPIAAIVDQVGPPSLLARTNDMLVLGARSSGMRVSTTHGDAWSQVGCPLHVGCLAESPSGEVWACTKNY